MRNNIIIVFVLFLFVSCGLNSGEEENAVARVGETYLLEAEVGKLLDEKTSKDDSIIIVNHYIRNWAQQQILLERAQMNLPEIKQSEFEALVRQYKADLYSNAYKEALVSQSMDTAVSDEVLEAYYEENKVNFKLNEDLLRLRYINVAKDYTELNAVRNAFRRYNEQDKAYLYNSTLKFKSYSFEDSTWVKSSNVIKQIPGLNTDNSHRYLKKSYFFELSDSLEVYLVIVNEVLGRSETAPLEYVKPTVRKIILNKRKLEFIRNLEKDLLDEATRNKEFEIFDEKKKQ
ncbi:peptidyl-prolyl cis-trans isomerase [Galbibacter sp. EGI 63066]|uniref:peptidyl-prolyl cis-trans isomerase n=1 Tax=Galbibacter sp. EGI 63066 TaxID=2993559 RepID=UPI00224972BC|nr:peptidyl-prolyl cis-trans isomerase [Galbibacter sp. EGI 63066]MCX2679611.1 peptidyl-prolyl cis-trans isomerase [Galbibacter sp. EGI 63066]